MAERCRKRHTPRGGIYRNVTDMPLGLQWDAPAICCSPDLPIMLLDFIVHVVSTEVANQLVGIDDMIVFLLCYRLFKSESRWTACSDGDPGALINIQCNQAQPAEFFTYINALSGRNSLVYQVLVYVGIGAFSNVLIDMLQADIYCVRIHLVGIF